MEHSPSPGIYGESAQNSLILSQPITTVPCNAFMVVNAPPQLYCQ